LSLLSLRSIVAFILLLGILLLGAVPALAEIRLEVDAERQWLRGKSNDVTLSLLDEHARPVAQRTAVISVEGRWTDAGGDLQGRELKFGADGVLRLEGVVVHSGSGAFSLQLDDGTTLQASTRAIHPMWPLLPALLSIAIALALRQVLLALTLGVFSGAWILGGGPLVAFRIAFEDIVATTLTDPFRAAILLFTAALGGMVAVMARAGGTRGLVDMVRHWIRDARSAQFATAVLGLMIFFDDYSNTLLVGNTMRPVTDRMRVSREKLSYIVDSTAAPVATVAWLSTWVGYQVGLISDGLKVVGQEGVSAYATFMSSVVYSGYSWLAMVLVFALVLMRRDFGPMYRAEVRARETGKVLADNARPLQDDVGLQDNHDPGVYRASLAVLPVLAVLAGTIAALWYSGRQALLSSIGPAGLAEVPLRDVFAEANPATSLLLAVTAGSIVAVLLAVGTRTLKLSDTMDSWVDGAKAMVPALIILILAWSIGDVCELLRTADVVVGAATGNLSAQFVPTITFLIAGFLAFSTGTSWGAMAILMPIVIPLSFELSAAAGLSDAHAQMIFLASIASVLSGSVFGDHCSPISDTTIMSSMASGADHIDHVRTQLPYALVAGVVAILLGTLPAGFGISPWLTLPIGAVTIVLLVRFVGRPIGEYP
ncbi:Na+/H+ antiporter NhaC family protein, partial [bacterium]